VCGGFCCEPSQHGGRDRPTVQGWSASGPRRAAPALASARPGLFFATKKCDTRFGFSSNRGGLSKCSTSLKLLKSFASGSPTSPTSLRPLRVLRLGKPAAPHLAKRGKTAAPKRRRTGGGPVSVQSPHGAGVAQW